MMIEFQVVKPRQSFGFSVKWFFPPTCVLTYEQHYNKENTVYPAFNKWCIYCYTPLQFLLPLIHSLPHPLSPLSISVRITYPAYILFTLYFIPLLWTHVHLCQNFCILSLYLIRVIGSWQPFLCLVPLQTATTNLASLHPHTPWLQRRCVGQVPMNS